MAVSAFLIICACKKNLSCVVCDFLSYLSARFYHVDRVLFYGLFSGLVCLGFPLCRVQWNAYAFTNIAQVYVRLPQ